ncbi:hypothetical protein LguiA_005175 [Lonicera macranthoides]
MDNLPSHLILEILSRLDDSFSLSRCRLASKTLNSLADEIPSINLQCSFDRYIKSRSPETRSETTPFKTIFNNLIKNSRLVECVRIGIEKPLRVVSYDDVEDESDDLYLSDEKFVEEWLPKVCERLKSVEISDFWIQSCWRRTEVLSLISSHCHNLIELDVKNAWLSVDNLNPMPMLTSLTLEFIRLDDENLNKVNDCFPSLRVLNLIGVGGLKEPKIHLLNLKTCQWTVSNAPSSLTILAPNLFQLKLKCVKPRELVIEAPLLSNLNLTLEKASEFKVKEFRCLKTLRLESRDLSNLLSSFPFGTTIETLIVDSSKSTDSVQSSHLVKISLEDLFNKFPNLSSLTLGSGVWSELQASPFLEGLEFNNKMKGLKEIIAYLVINDIETTLSLIFHVLERLPSLSNAGFLVHRDVDSSVTSSLISRCVARCSSVRWRWGMWKERMKDGWISNGI